MSMASLWTRLVNYSKFYWTLWELVIRDALHPLNTHVFAFVAGLFADNGCSRPVSFGQAGLGGKLGYHLPKCFESIWLKTSTIDSVTLPGHPNFQSVEKRVHWKAKGNESFREPQQKPWPQLNLMNSNSVNQGSSVSCGFWMCILATCCHHGSTCGGGICSRPKWCCNGGMGPPFWFQLTHAAHACHLAATWEVFRPSDLWSWVLLSPPQLRTNRASIWSLLGSCTDDSTFGDSVCEMPSACAGINGKNRDIWYMVYIAWL